MNKFLSKQYMRWYVIILTILYTIKNMGVTYAPERSIGYDQTGINYYLGSIGGDLNSISAYIAINTRIIGAVIICCLLLYLLKDKE